MSDAAAAVTRWRILPTRTLRTVEDLRDSLVIRNNSFFLLTDRDGAVPPGNLKGLGLYHDDTRYLSAWGFDLAGVELIPILSIADLGFAMEQVFICPELVNGGGGGEVLPAGRIHIRRQRVLDNQLVEASLRQLRRCDHRARVRGTWSVGSYVRVTPLNRGVRVCREWSC